MTAPLDAGRCLLSAFALGFLPGLLHSFLQPLRRKHKHIADLFSVIALLWCWVYVGFGVCGGDLRMGYLGGMMAGFTLCIYTLGRWLQWLFHWFYAGIHRLLRNILAFFRKIRKVLFAIKKK